LEIGQENKQNVFVKDC